MRKILLSLLFISPSVLADAASVESALGTVDPGRISKTAIPRTPQVLQPVQQVAPGTERFSQGTLPPAEAQRITFKLQQVIVDGNTVYRQNELQELVKHYLKKETVSLADIENLTQEITKKYRNDGYIISRAILPPQSIKNGVVHIQVLEGFVSDVVVKGAMTGGTPMVKTYGKQVSAIKPLTIQALERYLLLSNDMPGMNARGILTPSKTVPAGADLVLATEQKRYSGSVSYDNYGSRYLGPNRLIAGADMYSIFTPGDATSVRWTMTPDARELTSLGLSHSLLVGSNGARLTVGGSYSNTRPGFLLRSLDVRGRSEYAFIDLAYPVIRSRPKNLLVHASFNYLNSRTNFLGDPSINDRVRYLKVGATFSALDRWQGINALGFDVSQGLQGLGSSPNGSGLPSRQNGRVDFTKLEFNASRLQSLSPQFSALVAMTGQYAFTPLLSAQQFGVGGSEWGRGYSPSEILGDRGIAGKVELRWNPKSMPIPKVQQTQFYAFYDVGAIWNMSATIAAARGTPDTLSLASTGAGVRFQMLKNLSGDLFIAQPLTRPVQQEVDARNNARNPLAFFQVTLSL